MRLFREGLIRRIRYEFLWFGVGGGDDIDVNESNRNEKSKVV